METRKRKHAESIGVCKIKGGEFDGIEVEFMGTENNQEGKCTGLYLCLEYFAIALKWEYVDESSIKWYSAVEQGLFDKLELE